MSRKHPITLTLDPSDSLEDHPLFTPDLEYLTPSASILVNTESDYCPRTLTFDNRIRHTILPVFQPSTTLQGDTAYIQLFQYNDLEPPLLLCNVSPQKLSLIQLARRTENAYATCFQLIEHHFPMMNNSTDSFIISIHQQIIEDLSKKWKINGALLDYNLARLRQCAQICLQQWQQQQRQEYLQWIVPVPTTATFSIEELPIALEFYLQIDVDLFYLKTGTYRQAKPIEQTIFCTKEPDIRYCLTACNERDCICCHPTYPRMFPGQTEAIQFNHKETFRFVNGYETILNAPATCTTSNIIYALTCPCGNYDYLGVTTQSFRDCFLMHRRESNRIMREFILGTKVIQHLRTTSKTDDERYNDHQWLYQHTVRCPAAIQLFLDANRSYWCVIPMPISEAKVRRYSAVKTSTSWYRHINRSERLQIEADVKYLKNALPPPPLSYTFSHCQKQEQIQFFIEQKHRWHDQVFHIDVDLYNATIIALLPEPCSNMLQQFILSLFITHADCHLNRYGRLLNRSIRPPCLARGQWCSNLVRRPFFSFS